MFFLMWIGQFAALELPQGPEIRLEEVQRWGWEDPGTSRLGGGALAWITGVALGAREELYVLDAEYGKVVVFDPGGSVVRVFGGKGKGPGEFERPWDLALGPNGQVWVLDQATARLTVFNQSGQLVRTIPLPYSSPVRVIIQEDRVYLLRNFRRPGKPVVVLDTLGRFIRETGEFSEADAELAAHGSHGFLASLEPAGVVQVYTSPLTWAPLDAPGQRRGIPLPPANRPLLIRGYIRATLSHTRALVALPEERLLALYLIHDPRAVARDELKAVIQLGLFENGGRQIASTTLPEDTGQDLVVGKSGREVYLVRYEPFPQVVKYRLVHP
jgi:hypothetical protein